MNGWREGRKYVYWSKMLWIGWTVMRVQREGLIFHNPENVVNDLREGGNIFICPKMLWIGRIVVRVQKEFLIFPNPENVVNVWREGGKHIHLPKNVVNWLNCFESSKRRPDFFLTTIKCCEWLVRGWKICSLVQKCCERAKLLWWSLDRRPALFLNARLNSYIGIRWFGNDRESLYISWVLSWDRNLHLSISISLMGYCLIMPNYVQLIMGIRPFWPLVAIVLVSTMCNE